MLQEQIDILLSQMNNKIETYIKGLAEIISKITT